MKKLYATLILFISLQINAQFFEGFEYAMFPPAGWVVSDNGVGTSASWKRNIPLFPAYEGTNCAYIDRENVGVGNTSEDWLITPAIMVDTNKPLTFFSRQSLLGDDATSIYEVRISTTSQTDHSSFTVLNAWSETDLGPGLLYEQKIVSLAAYVGQTVYIAFVKVTHQTSLATSGDRWFLDNVSVGGTNLINGTIGFSADGSCGAGLHPLLGFSAIQAQYNTNVSNVFAYPDGHYTYTSLQTDFTLTPNFALPGYFNITPNNYTFNFPGLGNTANADFCITPNGIHPDLEITLLPRWNAYAGFLTSYVIVYRNKGNQTQSGAIALHFNDAIMEYVSSSPGVDAQSVGTLVWNFTDLLPFETRTIGYLNLNLNAPTDTPPVNAGDAISLTAEITTAQSDETPADNSFTLHQTAAASLDPNDKIVSEGSVIDISKVDDYLHYMIRFQNIGTADATNVVVRDILTENLDPATFEMIGSSHLCSTSLRNSKLEFAFENINLPSSTTDETASHGFVAFKIKPAATVGIGSEINNTASIYFDFNFPVLTNTTTTTVATLATHRFDASRFTLYPNPAKNILNIDIDDAIVMQSVSIYNPLGQVVKTISASEWQASTVIDVSQLKTGTYFVEINSNVGKMISKFVKL